MTTHPPQHHLNHPRSIPHPKPRQTRSPVRSFAMAALLVLAACNPKPAVAASPAEDVVGVWTGTGKLAFKGEYRIKLTLKNDKTCVLEYSDREPPHTLNPDLKSNKIVAAGPWRVEENEAENRIVIDAAISEWIETVSPAGERPSTSKIEPLPLGDGLSFAIQPDGTLKQALISFAGKSLLPGIPTKIQAIAVNLTKQDAQQP